MSKRSKKIRHIPVDGTPLVKLCEPSLLEKHFAKYEKQGYIENLIILFKDEEAIIACPEQDDDYYEMPLRFAGDAILVIYPYSAIELPDLKKAIDDGRIIGIAPAHDGTSSVERLADAQGLLPDQYLETLADYSKQYLLDSKDTEWFHKYLGMHVCNCDEETTLYDACYRPENALK